jgi:NAD(P)-dependent dehydrogenase (short-subunit alcohol dehydrogenase family)
MSRLQGRIALISSAGSARPLASSLASLGATVIVTMRDECDADALARSIALETGNLRVHGTVIDLGCPFSVREAASEFIARWQKLHVLVNDTSIPLGPTLLANLLLDTMKRSSGTGRVIRLAMPKAKHQVWTATDGGRNFAKCAS